MAETKEIKEEKNKVANVKDYDKSLIIIPVLLVAITVIWLLVDPEALTALSSVATVFVDKTTWIFLIIPLVLLVVLIWWACTPNGNIRMGGPLDSPNIRFTHMPLCYGAPDSAVLQSCCLSWNGRSTHRRPRLIQRRCHWTRFIIRFHTAFLTGVLRHAH